MDIIKTASIDMDIIKTASIIFSLLIITLALVVTTSILVQYEKPIGWDYRFHVGIAEEYASFNFDPVSVGIATNYGIYPPLFHFFIALLINIGLLLPASIIMQLIFYPLAIAVPVYFIGRRIGWQYSGIGGIILLGSVALFDRSQVIPQSLDMILIPLGLLFFLEKKRIPALVCLAITAYSHGIFSIPLVGIFLAIAWKRKDYMKIAKPALLLFIPILVLFAFSFTSYLDFSSGYNNPQEQILLNNPINAVLYFGIVPLSMLPISLVYLWKKGKLRSGSSRINLNQTMVYWLLLLSPLLIVMIDRFPSYAAAPISILGASAISTWFKGSKRNDKVVILAIIMLVLFGLVLYTSFNPIMRIVWGFGGARLDV